MLHSGASDFPYGGLVTQPIQEPGPSTRTDAKLTWGSNQLFRRPDPNTTPTISVFRALRPEGEDVTVPSTSIIAVDWIEWENCDEAVFFPLQTDGVTPADPGDIARYVFLDYDINPGRYTFCFGAVPSSGTIAGVTETAMQDADTGLGFADAVLHGATTGPGGSLGASFMTLTIVRTYPIFDPIGTPSDASTVSFTLAQTSTASENYSPCILEIQYERNVLFCEDSG